MDAPVPLILAALLAAGALVARAPRARAAAMLGALVLAPVILGFHIADSDQVQPLRDHPSLAVAGAVGAVVALAVLAVLFDRRPGVAAGGRRGDAALPRADRLGRLDGQPARAALPRRRGRRAGLRRAAAAPAGSAAERRPSRPGALEWALAASLALYAIQASLLGRLRPRAGERRLLLRPLRAAVRARGARGVDAAAGARRASACSSCLALALVGRRLRRVRDAPPVPQPEGHRLQPARGLLPGQLAVLRPQHLRALPGDRDARCSSAWLLWARRQREVVAGGAAARGAVGRAGADASRSRASPRCSSASPSSARCAGACAGRSRSRARRWSSRVAFVALAPGAVHLDLGNSKSADKATSGRYDLIKGGLKLFARRAARRPGLGLVRARVPPRRARLGRARGVGLAHDPGDGRGRAGRARAARLPRAARGRAARGCFRGARRVPERAAVAAAFVALAAHTMMYAAFLEDPLTWTLLGAGDAPWRCGAARRAREPAPRHEPAQREARVVVAALARRGARRRAARRRPTPTTTPTSTSSGGASSCTA